MTITAKDNAIGAAVAVTLTASSWSLQELSLILSIALTSVSIVWVFAQLVRFLCRWYAEVRGKRPVFVPSNKGEL